MADQTILITGCSSGIGLSTALDLKKRGYRVFAGARQATDVEKLQAQGFESVQLDVNNTHTMQTALDIILQRTGGTLYALFNNAGYLQAGAIEDLTRDMLRAQFETNVFGAMELTRLVLPIMRKQGYGRIIQNSSILGIITLPYYGAYNGSKFALEGLSSTLRQELRGTNIHVSIINPGPIISKLRTNAYDRYQHTLKQQVNVHEEAYKKLEQSYFHPDEKNKKIMQHPDAVTKKIIHALENANPKAHYYIGWPTKLMVFMKRILPDSAMDWILAKI